MPDPLAVADRLGWLVRGNRVVVPLGVRRHAVRSIPDASRGWLLRAEVPQTPGPGGLEALLRRNRSSGLAWFALDDEARLVVRSDVPADADNDEVGMHLRETARLADDHERMIREQDLL